MRLTTKGRYAVTAMLDLALHARHEPVSLADISDRQSISVSYLEQLFAKLRKHGLVSSVRGPGAATSWRGKAAKSLSPRSSTRWTSRWMPPAAAARATASRA